MKIQVLLERSATRGGSVDIDSIKTMKNAVPEIEFLVWKESDAESPYGSRVHAKCAVADSTTAFITSANLTNAAMETNMELGVLVRGGAIPGELRRHLEALIVIGEVGCLAQ